MSERLKYVDMVRGFAVLWMIFVQLFDMFFVLSIYDEIYWVIKQINWFPIFMIIAGFSLELMFEKYNTKKFYSKVVERFVLFACIGLFLTFWCDFQFSYLQIFDSEIVGAIGINLAFLSLFFLLPKKIRTVCLAFWLITVIVLHPFLQPYIGFFSIFRLQGFMVFGIILATFRKYGIFPICLPIFVLGLLNGGNADLWTNNIEFLSLNWGLTGLLLGIFEIRNFAFLSSFLNYFGRHGLFFYFFHFAIFQKILLVTGSYKEFGITESLILALCSVAILVGLETMRKSEMVIKIQNRILNGKNRIFGVLRNV